MKTFEIDGITYKFDESMFITEEIKVGDEVQILKKESSSWKTYPGVVVQILPFKGKPAVEVVYVENGWFDITVKTVLITEDSCEDIRMLTKAHPVITLTKERAIDLLQKKVTEAEEKLKQAQASLDYFNKYFGADYFGEAGRIDE